MEIEDVEGIGEDKERASFRAAGVATTDDLLNGGRDGHRELVDDRIGEGQIPSGSTTST